MALKAYFRCPPMSGKILDAFHGRRNSGVVTPLDGKRAGFAKAVDLLDRVVCWKDVSFCVFYSYWFTDSALVAGRLKARYGAKVNGFVRAASRAHGYDLYASRNPIGYIPYRGLQFGMLDLVAPCSEDGVGYLVGEWPKYSNLSRCFVVDVVFED